MTSPKQVMSPGLTYISCKYLCFIETTVHRKTCWSTGTHCSDSKPTSLWSYSPMLCVLWSSSINIFQIKQHKTVKSLWHMDGIDIRPTLFNQKSSLEHLVRWHKNQDYNNIWYLDYDYLVSLVYQAYFLLWYLVTLRNQLVWKQVT